MLVAWSSRTGGCETLLVAGLLAVGGAAMVAHHAQHVLAVLLEARERPELLRHLGGGRVADAGHDRGERAADRAARVAVVRNAGRHQQPADVGVAEAERAVLVGELRDLLARKLRHQHRDFEHDGPQPDGVLVALDVERAGLLVAIGEQVDRGEIARRVVEEHVFRARIAGADRSGRRAGVPVVHGGVELQAGIGAGPGRVADLLPQVARLHGLGDLLACCARSGPSRRRLRRPSGIRR